MSDAGESDAENLDLFAEPDGFYKEEAQPTFQTHTLLSGESLQVRLVGSNPLWGHMLWNAGRTVADFLERHVNDFISGRTVLELGAGAGLPSLVAAIRGARKVVVTDYPDSELIDNLEYNINHCDSLIQKDLVVARGYLWGNTAEPLLNLLSSEGTTDGFDTLILADLLFNHSEHRKLVQTMKATLGHGEKARALVFFTPYRPWLLEKDLAFFDVAQEEGFEVRKILEKLMEKVMFEEDPGDEVLRRTVFGYELKWSPSSL